MIRENDQGAMTESAARLRKRVLLVLVVMGLGALILSFGVAWCTGDWGGLALNAGTELGGGALTYYLFERVIGHMEKLKEEREAEKKRLEEEKARLIADMGSSEKSVAVPAAEKLARHDWLYDGSLRGVDFNGADLRGAPLFGADLQGAILSAADLRGTDLARADLRGADLAWAKLQTAILAWADLQEATLSRADLQGAILTWVDLRGADLFKANLQGADLLDADLQGADLLGADLQGADLFKANLQGAQLNESTTLPDGTKWTPDTDITRFTDLGHPDFWRPGA